MKFPSLHKILRTSIITLFFLVLLGIIGFLFARYILPFHLPSEQYSVVLVDKNNEEIGEILAENGNRHRTLTKDEIPKFYKEALIDLEDRRFYTHPGFDFLGFARAMQENIKAGKIVQGGSTLTMGLVRNSLWLNDDRTLWKKIAEIFYAIRLEGKLGKEEILAKYANQVSYGRLSLGLASAAKSYFGKSVQNLTDAESLALIAMAKNPKVYDAILEEENFRARFVMLAEKLATDKIITPEKKEEILAEKLTFPKPKNPLPYGVDAYKKLSAGGVGNLGNSGSSGGLSNSGNSEDPESSGQPIRTTLDLALTSKVASIADGVLTNIAWKNVSDYSVLLIDRDTLEIRTLIGGANFDSSHAGQVNAVFAARQVGSTLKPFIYLLAFEKFGYTPQDMIIDLPVAYETEDQTSYEPKNYSLDYQGSIRMGEALAGSVNIPAIRLTEKVGVENILSFLKKLGISSLNKPAEFYGLSLGLGTGEISLFELVQAYSLFAKKGNYCPLVFLHSEVSSCQKIVDSKYTDMIEESLTRREFKVRNFPVGSALDFSDRFAFVKTGTSRNFRDNYAVGYTDHFIIGVWTGNKDGENMKGVSGASGAGEIFGGIVRKLEAETSISGLTPKEFAKNESPFVEITSPLQFAKYRVDPGVPKETQKIELSYRTNIAHREHTWLLDGKKISEEFVSLPSLNPGKHTLILQLQDENGKRVKEVSREFSRESE